MIVAAVMPAPRVPVELREFPEPALEPGSALLRTAYSEVCGTDVHLWHGRLAGVPYPIIPGHVSVGHVEKLRGAITAADGRRVVEGDRLVFFDVHRTCGRCRACTVARTPTRCESRRVYGITDSAAEGLFGGWSQAIYLEPGVVVAHLPESVPAEAYIGGGCGLITSVHAIERADVSLGDTVLVQGTGAVGLSAIALAKLAGATRVIAIGAPADRLALAEVDGRRLPDRPRGGRRRPAPRRGAGADGRARRRHRDRAAGSARAGRRGALAGSATADGTSSRAITPTPGRARLTSTSRSTASTSRSEAAGAARSGTSCVRSGSSNSTTRRSVGGDRCADLRPGRIERRARRRGGDAAAQGPGEAELGATGARRKGEGAGVRTRRRCEA